MRLEADPSTPLGERTGAQTVRDSRSREEREQRWRKKAPPSDLRSGAIHKHHREYARAKVQGLASGLKKNENTGPGSDAPGKLGA